MKLTRKEIEVIILLAQKIIIELEKEETIVIDDVGQVYNPTQCKPCDD